MLIITKDSYNKLSPRLKAELLSAVFGEGRTPIETPSGIRFEDFDWEDRVDLTPGDIEVFVDGSANLYEGTIKGLEMIAKYGPIIHSSKLTEELNDDSGAPYFESLSTFQRSTTRRVRGMTGRKRDFLLAWNEWEDGEGYYAVTEETHRSLKVYFGLI